MGIWGADVALGHRKRGGGEPTMPRQVLFVYRGYHFHCASEREGPARYRPVLLRQLPWPDERLVGLLSDASTCRSEAEALRQAEAQAMRWVDARIGQSPALA